MSDTDGYTIPVTLGIGGPRIGWGRMGEDGVTLDVKFDEGEPDKFYPPLAYGSISINGVDL